MKFLMIYFIFSFSMTAGASPSPALQDISRLIDLKRQDSKVEFLAKGKQSLLNIRGSGNRLKGQIQIEKSKVSGEIIVPLESITTGLSMRDEHIKKNYLEIEKYPEATLKISKFVIPKNFLNEGGIQKNVPFKGKLKIHGTEHDVIGAADIASNKQFLIVNAKTKTTASNHKIIIPSSLGIKAIEDIEIKVELKIKND